MSRFRQAGLDNAISSWIGTEENVPITGPQLRQALGEAQIQQIATETGLPADESADQLSSMLPTSWTGSRRQDTYRRADWAT